MITFLKKPYPYLGEIQKDLKANVFIGLFIALFLIVFQPFGISEWTTQNKTMKLAGFGLISALVPSVICIISFYLHRYKSKEESWTIGKEIFYILIVLFFIALFNLFYGRLLGISVLSLSNFAAALFVTCAIGVFPVSFHVVRKHNRLLKLHLAESTRMTEQLERAQSAEEQTAESKSVFLVFTAENGKDKIQVNSDHLLYIESADNYSSIVSFDGKQQKKEMIRSSLKRLEAQISHRQLVRCHRTFIVNLEKVKKVEGNAAGYKLQLQSCDSTIPVSRNYVSAVKDKLKA